MTVRANVGLTYWVDGQRRRVEAGEIATDIPAQSLPWLIDQECVTVIEDEDQTDGEIR
jgi:hypothetical protein